MTTSFPIAFVDTAKFDIGWVNWTLVGVVTVVVSKGFVMRSKAWAFEGSLWIGRRVVAAVVVDSG